MDGWLEAAFKERDIVIETEGAARRLVGHDDTVVGGVRPVNGIFKAKEGFGKIDRGAVLTCLSSSSHTTTPGSDASQMPPGGARDDPGLGWEKTGSGLRDGQASAASPDRRNDCHRSGSSSSIRRAGWVLIRSSTSRR